MIMMMVKMADGKDGKQALAGVKNQAGATKLKGTPRLQRLRRRIVPRDSFHRSYDKQGSRKCAGVRGNEDGRGGRGLKERRRRGGGNRKRGIGKKTFFPSFFPPTPVPPSPHTHALPEKGSSAAKISLSLSLPAAAAAAGRKRLFTTAAAAASACTPAAPRPARAGREAARRPGRA